jgi:DNA topoisomerase-1
MKLVVVESPSKAKTINKYLGDEYKVISSVGHIIDLPKSKLGVDVEHKYEPQYEVIPGKNKVIKQLKDAAKTADAILLATDPDREGEAISWHIQNSLGKGKNKKPISRIVFHEITKPAILEAIKQPRDLDMNLVNAQQARRVLDRLVGYTLSPLLWKKIRYGLSAGRVQSVALRLIVDRERERQAFVPVEYWSIDVDPTDEKGTGKIHTYLKDDENKPQFAEDQFILDLKKINGKAAEVKTQKEFDHISSVISKSPITIQELAERQVKKHPNPPFTTSTFQQAAVNVLGMTSRNSMRTAQKLYEAGLITYMRTDSLNLSAQAVAGARDVIKAKFGDKYMPDKGVYYKTTSKSAQEAHEAIRPTNFNVTELPKGFAAQDQKVYDLIYRRALASQMSTALFTQKTIVAQVKDKDVYDFSATAQKCEFDGWMKLYKVNENKKLLKVIESLKTGSVLYAKDVYGIQHFTEPPARYTEASLIKALEKYGIGRPSTYASIVSVIMQRTYVEKEGKYFYPTDTGFVVTDFLKKHFSDIVDIDFTANMEDNLDKIANGDEKWVPVIDTFFSPFQQQVKKKDKEVNKEDVVVLGSTDEKCPECGKAMVKKLGKFGAFLSCTDFPTCKGMKSLGNGEGESENLEEKVNSEEFKETYKPSPKTDDGRPYLLKKGRFGEFWAHPDYPKVKDARPLEYTDAKMKELFGDAPKATDGKVMILRRGKFGYFWAHPDYPTVKEIVKVKRSKTK